MRKYLFNGKILTAAVGAWSAIRQTRVGPRDWRLALGWASWAITAALAIGTVIQSNRDEQVKALENSRR
ncbi:MAG: hypothetical protein ABI255_10340 [Microbacteriaceae bacterium]